MNKFVINNKKIIYIIASVILLIILSLLIYVNSVAYLVSIDGKTIGIVKNKEQVIQLTSELAKKCEEEFKKEVNIPQNISFQKVFATGKNIVSVDELKLELEKEIEVKVEAYIIKCNSEKIAIVDDEECANKILENLKFQYIDKELEPQFKEIGFLETVEVIQEYVSPNLITSVEDAFSLISTGTNEIKKYEIEEGDVISCIAEEYKLKVADIEKANPEINIDKIKIGQKISLTVPKPLISVKTVEENQYVEEKPFIVEYEESNNMYEGEYKVTVKGQNGSNQIKAEIVKINGIEAERTILEESIITEPVSQVVVKGTKERPKTMATGSFGWPSGGSITSKFGYRWGRNHNGIDFGVSTGTPIKASDGGKITFAGWKGGYGYLVIIDHENGYSTYYGHNSILKVKAGERVYKGQTISLSGNTGNSTGPHLHFEIRKNGEPINPLNKL
ncbi:peptidoglycan DD-metalloendopeptidase family protein [Clostridium grantii]|uniref:Murein DD-endopeptidase MepM and murein hydrolase activator NlpD, contain LysM domain n=1 Tax=Clostridium grantii DSM 8605 TaxID=1121316 RepID=A0A1M5QMK1_9CLOT|nr:M23 family metallopeptidase [Clostridium grantii]SHH15198.1 Murein DD-endopeptidase MepM and murein hydrolase activator NlpD, contain LysM domain [Clostridium grantii DSM 8605]